VARLRLPLDNVVQTDSVFAMCYFVVLLETESPGLIPTAVYIPQSLVSMRSPGALDPRSEADREDSSIGGGSVLADALDRQPLVWGHASLGEVLAADVKGLPIVGACAVVVVACGGIRG